MTTLLSAAAHLAGLFSLGFTLFSILASWLISRRNSRKEVASPSPLPPVTILKPLKGSESTLYENLKSFCRLEGSVLQILFTVSDPEDPSLDVVRRLKSEFPHLDLEVVVSSRRIGSNPKISNLANAEPLIKHQFLLISDSDVRVRPDFLRRALAPFENKKVGLVTCLYRSLPPRGIWERLEALAVEIQFFPQAVSAIACGMRFAMGAAVIMRKDVFDEIGGFKALANQLADDFVLGQAVQAAEFEIAVAEPIVETASVAENFSAHLKHQIRWAKTIRSCRSFGYAGLFFLQGFTLLTIKMAVLGPTALDWAMLSAIWSAKAVVGRVSLKSLFLIPASEWTNSIAWALGFGSSTIVWRGESLSVAGDGRVMGVRS